jgi:hypothetical protein
MPREPASFGAVRAKTVKIPACGELVVKRFVPLIT